VKRNAIIIGAVAIVAIILVWYLALYSPLNDDLSAAQTELTTEQKRTDDLQADLARLKAQEKNSTQQAALLRRLDAAVPEQPDLAEFILQANEIASESGISFLSIAPAPPAAGTGASVIGLTISIQGSFFQLEDYLRLLENLERLVIVDGITISSSTGTESSGDGTTLSVTLTGRMFTRAAPTTSADGTTPAPTDGTTTTTTPGSTDSTTTTAPGSATGGT
jgi:Tfp pilus assembly protein PilO